MSGTQVERCCPTPSELCPGKESHTRHARTSFSLSLSLLLTKQRKKRGNQNAAGGILKTTQGLASTQDVDMDGWMDCWMDGLWRWPGSSEGPALIARQVRGACVVMAMASNPNRDTGRRTWACLPARK